MLDKTELRKSMLAKRKQLTAEERGQAGQAAMQQVLQLVAGCRTVMLYMPFRGELDTLPLAHELERQGIGVAVPLTDQANRKLTPALLKGTAALVPGAYGILEPAIGHYRELSATALDAVIVPGVAFDLMGYRIGYGGGYYDRFLPSLRPDCLTIGYAYHWQVVDQVPKDAWDARLSWLATDTSVFATKRD